MYDCYYAILRTNFTKCIIVIRYQVQKKAYDDKRCIICI